MSLHEMGYLIRFDQLEAKKRLLAALRKAGTHKGDAAKIFECNHKTLIRWIDELGISGDVEAMIATAIKEGWHHGRVGGRPRHELTSKPARKAKGKRSAKEESTRPKRKAAAA